MCITNGPEIRTFITSGLYEAAINCGHEPFLLLDDKRRFEELINLKDYNVIDLRSIRKSEFCTKLGNKVLELFYKSWKYSVLNSKYSLIHFTGSVENNSSRFGRVLSSLRIPYLSRFLLRILYYINRSKTIKLDLLYFVSNQSSFIQNVINDYRLSGTRLIYITNNWKDIYSNFNFVHIPDNTTFWYKELQNAGRNLGMGVSKSKSVILGNPYFLFLRKKLFEGNDESDLSHYGISKDEKFFLWTLSQKSVCQNEANVIRSILSLLKLKHGSEIKLVVRRNPLYLEFDDSELLNDSNVIMAKNFWEVNVKTNIVYQSYKGELEWIKLLKNAEAVISYPSTVALESAIAQIPFYCLLLDTNNEVDPTVKKYWDSDLFKALRSDKSFIHFNIECFGDMLDIRKTNGNLRNVKENIGVVESCVKGRIEEYFEL